MRSISCEIIGAAFGLGSSRQETAKAPATYRDHNIIDRIKRLGHTVHDGGDVEIPLHSGTPENLKLRYGSEVVTFGNALGRRVKAALAANRMPVILGGDHSISIASVSAIAEHYRKKSSAKNNIGLLWIDAHTDLNTPETTPSGNIHGMSVGALLGHGDPSLTMLFGPAPKLKPNNVAFVGLRDVDPGERQLLKKLGMVAFTMKEIDAIGIGAVMKKALAHITKNTTGFVASFDLDVCDPTIAPGVGTPVRGGLTFRESMYVMESVADTGKLLSVEIVEYNPTVDESGKTCELGVSLIESALGKSIL